MTKRQWWIAAAAFVLLAIVLLSPLAGAQEEVDAICPLRADTAAELAALFGEELVGGGKSGEAEIAEFYLAPSGSWTMTVTGRAGRSCILIGGEDWQVGAPPLPGEKAA